MSNSQKQSARPHALDGIIRQKEGRWTIELNAADPALEANVGKNIRLIYWADVEGNAELSDLEQIAQRQQLEITIVAEGLKAEGALSNTDGGESDFLDRVKR